MKLISYMFFSFAIKSLSYIFTKSNNYLRTTRLSLSYQPNINNQLIRTVKNKQSYGDNDIELFYKENEYMRNKKIITISPGGFKGFYMLGICKYIKEHYDLSEFIFTGASAGSWNALLLCSNKSIQEIETAIFDDLLQQTKSIYELEVTMKNRLLSNYKSEDFDFNRLFVGVTTLEKYTSETTIFSGFENLEDALNCCIASSHIPLISGNITTTYQNKLAFDGGFSKYPYLNTSSSVLHITPGLWGRKNTTLAYQKDKMSISDYTTLFSKNKFIFKDLIGHGYNDTHKNKHVLDDIFTQL